MDTVDTIEFRVFIPPDPAQQERDDGGMLMACCEIVANGEVLNRHGQGTDPIDWDELVNSTQFDGDYCLAVCPCGWPMCRPETPYEIRHQGDLIHCRIDWSKFWEGPRVFRWRRVEYTAAVSQALHAARQVLATRPPTEEDRKGCEFLPDDEITNLGHADFTLRRFNACLARFEVLSGMHGSRLRCLRSPEESWSGKALPLGAVSVPGPYVERFEFGAPYVTAGWLDLTLYLDRLVYHFLVSYVSAPLDDMIDALLHLSEQEDGQPVHTGAVTVDWVGEPAGYRWVLQRLDARDLSVAVDYLSNMWTDSSAKGQRVFGVRLPWRRFTAEIARLGRQLLMQHGLLGYRSEWIDRDFPFVRLRELEAVAHGVPVSRRWNTLADDIAYLSGLLALPTGYHEAKMEQRRRGWLVPYKAEGASPDPLPTVRWPRPTVSVAALRRIRGHGATVQPHDAYGFLLGSVDGKFIYAALPAASTERDLHHARWFGWMNDGFGCGHASGTAHELARRRGLAIVGLYHTVHGATPHREILADVPEAFRNGLVLLYPLPSAQAYWPRLLFRRHQGGDWRSMECEVQPFRNPEMRLNPRRIHTDWLQMTGRRRTNTPGTVNRTQEATPSAAATPGARAGESAANMPNTPSAAERRPVSPTAEWDAVRLPVDAAADPSPLVKHLHAVLVAGETLRVRYHGGSRPGAVRHLRPVELFRVPNRQETYLVAHDLDQAADRTYCLSRLELLPEAPPAP